jgi:peptidoglycan/xylan/chitin deacetylase (PgdA/CDA1 family)
MTFASVALKTAGQFVPCRYRPPAGVLFPYGHIVADLAPVLVSNLYAVPSVAKFREDLDELCRRYRPVRLDELDELPRKRQDAAAEGFVLSFDDGMRQVYDVIAPILREKGLPAIFFLNSETVDNKRLMWRHKVGLLVDQARSSPDRALSFLSRMAGSTPTEKLNALRYSDEALIDEIAASFEVDFGDYLRREQPYLTSSQIQELARAGFEFGAHSASHPYFSELEEAEQQRQIRTSVEFIRSLGLRCRSFAFPFHDKGVPISIYRYMTDLNLTLSFGTSEARVDSVAFSFQRFALDAGNAGAGLSEILSRLFFKSLVRTLTRTEAIRRD